jgi:hypothetical protein
MFAHQEVGHGGWAELSRAMTVARLHDAYGAAADNTDDTWTTVYIGDFPAPAPLPGADAELRTAIEEVIARYGLPPPVVLDTLNEIYCDIQNGESQVLGEAA